MPILAERAGQFRQVGSWIMQAGRNGRCNLSWNAEPRATLFPLSTYPMRTETEEEQGSGRATRCSFSLAEMRYLPRGCGERALSGGKDRAARCARTTIPRVPSCGCAG